MMSIGNRPSFNDTNKSVEVNIFDFNETIYGKTIRVIVKKFLRPQQKFSDLENLKAQIEIDKEQSLTVL